ncbi:hypothetical protein D3C86_1273240 [compost metagenome]
MANVIFYSTGEIFWVSDPPFPFGKPHIGVPQIFAAVPPDHFFTYSMVAHVLEQNGHKIVGAFGRQRKMVRETKGNDPEILALGTIENPADTVLILISTDSDSNEKGGSDFYERVPFSAEEKRAVQEFRSRGGGIYVTSDHGPLGYQSLVELDLHHPIEPEPKAHLRPNVEWSNDSTDSAKVRVKGQIKNLSNGTYDDYDDIWLSVGPPAGYLQKIVPAELLYKEKINCKIIDGKEVCDLKPVPQTPHPIFNGVGDIDGVWIPAHMHESIFKIRATLKGIDETQVSEQKIKTLAVHVPFTETTFNSFAVMCYRDSEWEIIDNTKKLTQGRILWDSSFHHLVDINWVSDGKVTWDPYVPFSAQALWKQQLPPELFEKRMEKGMKRLIVNIISWLAHQLPGKPSSNISPSTIIEKSFKAFTNISANTYKAEDNYPDPKDLIH